MKKAKWYVCPACGGLTVSSGGTEVCCCGRPLEALEVQKPTRPTRCASSRRRTRIRHRGSPHGAGAFHHVRRAGLGRQPEALARVASVGSAGAPAPGAWPAAVALQPGRAVREEYLSVESALRRKRSRRDDSARRLLDGKNGMRVCVEGLCSKISDVNVRCAAVILSVGQGYSSGA